MEYTALHIAVCSSDEEMMHLLVDAGADPTAQDYLGILIISTPNLP